VLSTKLELNNRLFEFEVDRLNETYQNILPLSENLLKQHYLEHDVYSFILVKTGQTISK